MRQVSRIACLVVFAGTAAVAAAGPGTGATPERPNNPIGRPDPGKPERGAPPNDTCAGAIPISSNSTTIADQTGGTQEGDPGYSCHNGGVGTQGFANIWYSFVATSTTARVHTCDTTAVGDSLLAVYDVDESDPCNTLVEIGCSDDACGFTEFLSRIDLLNLVVGETYYIQLGAWTPADVGPYTLVIQSPIPGASVPCPEGATQEGEADCLSSNPGCAAQGGGPDPNLSTPITLPATVCGTSSLTSLEPLARDNDYYRFNLAQESSVTVTIQAEFNVQAAILYGSGTLACPNPFSFWEQVSPVAGDLATMTVCLPAGDWLLLVRPQAGQEVFDCAAGRRYVLTATSAGPCESCPATPPPGATFEGELAGGGDCGGWLGGVDFFNGGCNSVPPAFSAIECGDTIYGTTASTGAQRDTDWYDLTLAEGGEVTWSGTSENYELVIGIIDANPDTGDCPSSGFRIAAVAKPCSTASVTDTLAPGRYFFFAAADFTPAVNCPAAESDPNYVVTLTCGTGGGDDCNENGVPDSQDISGGTSRDCFSAGAPPQGGLFVAGGPNGTPDECECIADWDRNGVANSTDVSELINTFFADQAGGTTFADIDCNGTSNSTDVSEFINLFFAAQAAQLPFAGCQI